MEYHNDLHYEKEKIYTSIQRNEYPLHLDEFLEDFNDLPLHNLDRLHLTDSVLNAPNPPVFSHQM